MVFLPVRARVRQNYPTVDTESFFSCDFRHLLMTNRWSKVTCQVPLVEQEMWTLHGQPCPLGLCHVSVVEYSFVCVVFCRAWCFLFLSFLILRFLLVPIVSSNFSCRWWHVTRQTYACYSLFLSECNLPHQYAHRCVSMLSKGGLRRR